MLSLQETLDLANGRSKLKIPDYVNTWRGVYYGMSLHIDGACPAFQDLRYNARERVYTLSAKQTLPNNYFGAPYQQIFDSYLFSRHPKEPEMMRQWRYSQYKPFTQAPFQQVIQVITGAIFQDSGYSINIQDRKDNDYIWGNNFHGKNLVGYLTDNFQNICEDPNGVLVVMPKHSRIETQREVEPELYFVHSKYIRWHSKHEIIFDRDELIWSVNSLGYFRFGKEGNQYVHMDDDIGGYYAHMMYRMPVIIAGGLWNAQGFFQSWLQAAKAWADEFVSAKSAEQLVNKDASHPYTIEANTDCDSCNGTGSIEYKCDCGTCNECRAGVAKLHKCDKCKGAGYMSRNPGDRLIVPANEMGNDLIKIVTPAVDINKFHAENNASMYKSMLQALHLDYIDQAQSGVAKDKDMETRYQFILRITNDLFDRLIPEILNYILALRNVTVTPTGDITPAVGAYQIVKPTQFQIKTSYDLLQEYKEATESKLPNYQLNQLVEDYVDKQFGGNDVLKKKTWFINRSDKLANINISDISVIILNGGAEQRDLQYTTNISNIIDRIVLSKGNEWFINATFDVLETEVKSRFDTILPPSPTIIDNTEERVNV